MAAALRRAAQPPNKIADSCQDGIRLVAMRRMPTPVQHESLAVGHRALQNIELRERPIFILPALDREQRTADGR